jgi:hypothetical protein
MTIRSALMALFTMPPHGGNLAGSTRRPVKPPLTEGKTRHRSRDFRPTAPLPPPPPATNYSEVRHGMRYLTQEGPGRGLHLALFCSKCLNPVEPDAECCGHCGFPFGPRNIEIREGQVRRGATHGGPR